MEGSSESIQEVAIEIPIQKEEKVFRNEAENSPPDMQAEPSGKAVSPQKQLSHKLCCTFQSRDGL